MNSARRTVPTTVKMLCGILIVAPLIEGAGRYAQSQGDIPPYRELPSVWTWLSSLGMHALMAVGLAKGVNWLRWAFVVIAGLGLLLEFISVMTFGPIIRGSPPPLPMGVGLALWSAYLAAFTLCFASSAGDYFRKKKEPIQLLRATDQDKSGGGEAGGER